MSQINVSHLTFAYDGSYDYIFDDVSLTLDTDWRLGFTGRNGRGKTTFLKLLAGQYEYRGSISAAVSFDYFPFAVREPERDSLEVVGEVYPELELWRLRRELARLQMAEEVLYRPFHTLSNGEQTKLLLATLFLKENNFPLIDEPTNHLDLRSRRLVSDYLRGQKGFILVSHDRALLDNCVDHILSINRADIELQQGNFSSWWVNRQRTEQFERAEHERLRKDVERLTAASRTAARWSEQVESTMFGTKVSGVKPDKGHIGHQSAKMMKRAKGIEERRRRAAEEQAQLLQNVEYGGELKINPLRHHRSILVEASELSLRYGDKTVCDKVSFSVLQGERVAVTGDNGSGKSSLLKLICGEDIAYDGTLRRAGGLKISYVAQDPSFLRGSLTELARAGGIDQTLFRAILAKLGFAAAQFDKDMNAFSDGQKKKVLIARSLCEAAHLYIWDEALNYIDVLSRIQIEELILAHRPTMIVVEHDQAFIDAVADKRIEL